jgi:hypothetical protein
MMICMDANCVIYLIERNPLWALHLATAIEHGCGIFLTNDAQLGCCSAIPVEVLT